MYPRGTFRSLSKPLENICNFNSIFCYCLLWVDCTPSSKCEQTLSLHIHVQFPKKVMILYKVLSWKGFQLLSGLQINGWCTITGDLIAVLSGWGFQKLLLRTSIKLVGTTKGNSVLFWKSAVNMWALQLLYEIVNWAVLSPRKAPASTVDMPLVCHGGISAFCRQWRNGNCHSIQGL